MSLNIVFMGTPDFAATNLKSLIDANYNVSAVFCQPDKPQGRRMILTAPPVKNLALENSISVYQPTTLKSEEIYEIFKQLNPDLIVVVAYGKILPKNILDLPKYGCINVHGSLLPKYRGASPIQTSIIEGEKITGITTMYMDESMDTGDIIYQEEIVIDDDDTSDILYEKLADLGSKLLVKTVNSIANGNAPRIKQDDTKATYCKIFTKEDGVINWNDNSFNIHNKVRGMNSWPCAYTFLNEKKYKIWKTKVLDEKTEKNPGEIVSSDIKNGLKIATLDGIISILEIQAEGKKRMNIKDFFVGNKI